MRAVYVDGGSHRGELWFEEAGCRDERCGLGNAGCKEESCRWVGLGSEMRAVNGSGVDECTGKGCGWKWVQM